MPSGFAEQFGTDGAVDATGCNAGCADPFPGCWTTMASHGASVVAMRAGLLGSGRDHGAYGARTGRPVELVSRCRPARNESNYAEKVFLSEFFTRQRFHFGPVGPLPCNR